MPLKADIQANPVGSMVDLAIKYSDAILSIAPGDREWRAGIFRVCMNMVRDELDHGENWSWSRLAQRLNTYREYVHEQTCAKTLMPGCVCVVCGNVGLPGAVA